MEKNEKIKNEIQNLQILTVSDKNRIDELENQIEQIIQDEFIKNKLRIKNMFNNLHKL